MNDTGLGVPRIGAPPPRAVEQACDLATRLIPHLEEIKYTGRERRIHGDGRTATFTIQLYGIGRLGLDDLLPGYDIRQIGPGRFSVQREG